MVLRTKSIFKYIRPRGFFIHSLILFYTFIYYTRVCGRPIFLTISSVKQYRTIFFIIKHRNGWVSSVCVCMYCPKYVIENKNRRKCISTYIIWIITAVGFPVTIVFFSSMILCLMLRIFHVIPQTGQTTDQWVPTLYVYSRKN